MKGYKYQLDNSMIPQQAFFAEHRCAVGISFAIKEDIE
jgi:hypothetical protein